MKFLKKVLGINEPESSQLKFKPPEERPAPRRRVEVMAAEPVPAEKDKENPFLDDQFADLEIVNDVSSVKDDPYASNSWKLDRDSDTRKLKTLHLGIQPEKKSDEDFNPYDTGVFRRGWRD